MNKVRAKFQVWTKDPGEEGNVHLHPVMMGSEENKAFWNATPAGDITMYITNPTAFSAFEVGKEYYVDFTQVEEE